jgi:hypothetical protein
MGLSRCDGFAQGSMLFDVYFNLGSFCGGLCTVGAYAAREKGDDKFIGVAIALVIFAIWARAFRWHLRHHAECNEWSFARRLAPLICYLAGLLLAFLAESRMI